MSPRLIQLPMLREIAAVVTAQFGISRTPHSIDVRLKMLAAYDGGPEGGL